MFGRGSRKRLSSRSVSAGGSLAPRSPSPPRSNLWLRPAARPGGSPLSPCAAVLGARPRSSPSPALSQPCGCLSLGRAPFLIPCVPVPVPPVPQPALTLLFLQLTASGEPERGQPCNTCGDQCPGFALHKWR